MPEKTEVAPENTPIEAETTPTPSPGESTSTGPLELTTDQSVMVGGVTLTGAELADQLSEVGRLKEYERHAGRLMSQGEDLPMDQRLESTEYLLLSQGYDPIDVQQYLKEIQEGPTNVPEETPAPNNQPPAPIPNQVQDRMAALEREQEFTRQRQERNEVEALQNKMRETIAGTLDSSQDIGVLLNARERLGSTEDREALREVFANELERVTLELCQARQARGETFNSSWLAQEGENAAKVVAKTFRAVIGDPDKLQRAPETGTGSSGMYPTEAPKDPVWEGEDAGAAQTKVKDYTLAALMHAAGQNRGGATKA